MFLKYRYRLGFEPLCREVQDSITWQRFCRIPLGGKVPHPSTLMKITTRCGETAVNGLNEALLAKAAEARVLKTNRVRADTTVVEANVAYPTDSGLLTKGIATIGRAAARLHAAGVASRTRFRDRSRSARARCRAINVSLRRRSDDRQRDVVRINREILAIARATVRDAQRLVRNARRAVRTHPGRVDGRIRALIDRVEVTAARMVKVAEQCATRLAGGTPEGATRIVSLHDPDARAISKGRIHKPVEFGYKAQIVDNDDGVVLDHNVEIGNPLDGPMLAPAIARITRRVGRVPRAVTADRGYGEHAVEHALDELGVRTVVLPRKGKPNAARREVEHRPAFKKLVRWRTGSEGRISCLKRDFGLARTRNDTIAGARTWCGHGIFAHNLVKIAGLIEPN
jgi:IS5 family transposase